MIGIQRTCARSVRPTCYLISTDTSRVDQRSYTLNLADTALAESIDKMICQMVYLVNFFLVANSLRTSSTDTLTNNIVSVYVFLEIIPLVTLTRELYSGSSLVLDYQPANVSAIERANDIRTEPRLSKRYRIRSMDFCPYPGMPFEYNEFVSSVCVNDTSPREYSIECARPDTPIGAGPLSYRNGFCYEDEICVSRTSSTHLAAVALCFMGTAMITLAENAFADKTRRVVDRLYHPSQSGLNLELILTVSTKDQTSVKASSISLAPRGQNNVGMVNPVSCKACSRMNFLNAPANVDNFDINVTFANAQDVATLRSYSWYW